MVLCFLGVVGIAVNKQQPAENLTSAEPITSKSEVLGIFVCFLMSWFYAACNVVNRKLKNVHFAIICFYHPIVGISISLLCLVIAFMFTGKFLEIHTL